MGKEKKGKEKKGKKAENKPAIISQANLKKPSIKKPEIQVEERFTKKGDPMVKVRANDIKYSEIHYKNRIFRTLSVPKDPD